MYPKDLASKREKKLKKDQQKKDKRKEERKEEEDIKDFFNSHLVLRKDIPDIIFIEQIEFLVQTMVL